MKKDILLERINELSKKVQESLENHQKIKTALDNATHSHNALVGRLDEATYQYQEWNRLEEMEKKASSKEKK